MELTEFTKNAIKTESRIKKVKFSKDILEQALLAFIASSEILDMIKKNVFYGKPIDGEAMISSSIGVEEAGQFFASHLVDSPKTVDSFPVDKHMINPRLFHAIIGICTESGELAELLYKTMSSNRTTFDVVNFGEELGDIDWYKAIGADAANLDQSVILETVIKKLQKRFPDKFTSEAAINRDVGAERELLERNLE